MSRYYKVVKDGYIFSIGTGGFAGLEIPESEYAVIRNVIHEKPEDMGTTKYRLRENLTWEEYEVEPPDPDPDIDDAELLSILMGGAE